MTKRERLNRLFDQMQKEYPDYSRNFKRDGINNEELFHSQKLKGKAVLFIAKEPNNKDVEEQIDDFREWWKKPLEFSFSMRLAEWAYGIINNFPDYDEAKKNRNIGLQSVAFMNLKKSGGVGTANNAKLWEVIRDTRSYLLEEIEIIAPDIIVGSLTYNQAWKNLFGELLWIDTGYDVRVSRWNNRKIIDYYHPSNRFPRAMNYCLLEKVCRSKVFMKL